MTTRNFALVLGIAFLLIGILGFIPPLVQPPHADHDLRITNPGHGMLLGLFHVNVLHNVVHILFGVLGVAMYRNYGTARLYARIVAISYGLLVILGLFPATYTLFGFVPIDGHDVWLHALIALAAAYFGFIAPSMEMPTDTHTTAGTSRT